MDVKSYKRKLEGGDLNLKLKIMLIALMASMLCCGCQAKATEEVTNTSTAEKVQTKQMTEPVSKEVFAMDTYMTLTAYGENAQTAVDEAAKEITRLEEMLSIGKEDSEVALINANGEGKVSDETGEMLDYALSLSEQSGGAFDITVYPLMKVWGFTDKEYKVPEDKEIQEALHKIDSGKVQYDKEQHYVTLAKKDMAIDLGGIAKGYASDKVAEIFRKNGVESGIVNLGGNVKTIGTKETGANWKVAIQNPDVQEEYIGVVEVADKVVITYSIRSNVQFKGNYYGGNECTL